MSISTAFVRCLFFILSIIFMTSYTVGLDPQPTFLAYAMGAILGASIGGVLICLDFLFKRFNLRSFNIALIGLFFGYLMGLALTLIFNAAIELSGANTDHFLVGAIPIFLTLFGIYLGVIMTVRASDEVYLSIPFIKLTPTTQQIKDIVLDASSLADARIIDLAASGLLDKRLLLPRFLLKVLQKQEDEPDEIVSAKAKRALDIVRKLEIMPSLHLRYQDTDFPEVKDPTGKILRLARLLESDVLSADTSRLQEGYTEGVRIINIHALSNALKPLMQRGEFLKIKIQRYGKEDLQGVGYLEDGTMVVVNGGGDFVGETISARVLSVKHTASGRMIFCNVAEDTVAAYESDDY